MGQVVTGATNPLSGSEATGAGSHLLIILLVIALPESLIAFAVYRLRSK